MTTQKTKLQHFVPQFYLRKFSSDKKKIYTYDKGKMISELRSTKKVAQEHYFYDLKEEWIPIVHRDPSLDLQTVENTLSYLENDFSKILTEFLALSSSDTITSEQRQRMAVFLSFQYVRTRDFRNFVIEAHKKLKQMMASYITKKKFPGNEDLTPIALESEDSATLRQNQHMFNIQKAIERAKELAQHIWLIGVNPSGEFNYTSDSPVITRNISGSAGLTTGFAIPGAEVIFPLSYDRVLILRERSAFKSEEKLDGQTISLNPNQVKEFNELQVIHSDNQIFSMYDDFTLIDEMIRSNPSLFSGKPERITINEDDPMFGPLKIAMDELIRQSEEEENSTRTG